MARGPSLQRAFCVACGFVPENRSQALAHSANPGHSIVRERVCRCCHRPLADEEVES